MFFKQYYLGCLAHASYLLGDEETGVGVVVDPQRDIDEYLADAKATGLSIDHVFLSHFHADFVAGHLELREETGAKIYLGARAEAEYDFVPVKDGDTFEWGKLRLMGLETPGHTPEGLSLVVYDLAESPDMPKMVLTGDTLFVGDVGRPDLLASLGVTAEELADMLYTSLHDKLLALPDATMVYPAHGAGSLCGKKLGDVNWSTIGAERKENYALQPMTREAFIDMATSDLPAQPEYFVHDAILNRQERATLEATLAKALKPIPLDEVLERKAAGDWQVLDVRQPGEFAGAHLADTVNVPLEGRYASWAGTVLDLKVPIVIVADPGTEEEAAIRLGRIGFDHVAGYLRDGMVALAGRDDLVAQADRVTVPTLAEMLEGDDAPPVVDVRGIGEWEAGHIPGSVCIPLDQLRDRMDEVPRGRRFAVNCRTGYRSSIAVSLLAQAGIEDAMDVIGGFVAWEADGYPVERPEPTAT